MMTLVISDSFKPKLIEEQNTKENIKKMNKWARKRRARESVNSVQGF